MKNVFVVDNVVVGHATAHQDGVALFSTAEGAATYEVPDDTPVNVGYAVSEDEAGNPVFTAPAPIPPAVSPIQFMLLFTAPERIAIKALTATDHVMADFMSLMNDPRLEQVDLALGSTQQGIEYALGAVAGEMNPAYTADTIQTRLAAILTGK